MKKCPNCGKMNLDKSDVCKECQCEIDCVAPGTFAIHSAAMSEEIQPKKRVTNYGRNIVTVLLAIVMFPIAWIAIYLWNGYDIIANGSDYYGGWTISFYALLVSIGIVLIGFAIEYLKSDEQKLIDIQFDNDQTSICPHCGSHNIKIYRKGYNYGKGLKWSLLGGGRYGRYVAGMDSNKACCRCMNCGNDWETDYDYRLIH